MTRKENGKCKYYLNAHKGGGKVVGTEGVKGGREAELDLGYQMELCRAVKPLEET